MFGLKRSNKLFQRTPAMGQAENRLQSGFNDHPASSGLTKPGAAEHVVGPDQDQNSGDPTGWWRTSRKRQAAAAPFLALRAHYAERSLERREASDTAWQIRWLLAAGVPGCRGGNLPRPRRALTGPTLGRTSRLSHRPQHGTNACPP
jgi:hypothetical protein